MIRKVKKNEKIRKSRSRLPVAERKKLSKILHQRIHYGKTQYVIDALKDAYDVNFELYDDPCDACMWSKAKFKPKPKHSTRRAKRVGERLHFDVFTSSFRSDSQCKYMLVIIDEYSNYIWAFGMRKKSETMNILQALIRRIEKMIQNKVDVVGCNDSSNGVESLRCDNAGENVLEKMKSWLDDRGTMMETTIPHTPYQNGKAERLGGVVWKGGAAFRYGGNLPNEEWLRCCLAYVHVKNRLPCSNSIDKLTPYELRIT